MIDLHVHTNYCDGADTPREIVEAAIAKGMKCIGFSSHSYTFFDESYCMKKEKTQDYKREINSLKKEYASKIKILCGIEQDFYSDMPTDGYDYVIGSVHYIKAGSDYLPVDESIEIQKDIINKYYGGCAYSFAADYFKAVSSLPKSTDIIGHFDLISKFNDGNVLFDESDERYIKAYRAAINSLVKLNIPFEVNTGAVSRGYKKCAYPSKEQLEYIKLCGGRVILSSDSHKKDTLCFGFEKEKRLLSELGFTL